MSYIDGLATGLDTTAIIKAMMDVEAIPKTLLEQRAATVKAGLDAFASIRSRTSALRSAADALATPAAWRALTATSSNSEAVSVAAGIGTPSGSLSFSVTSLARAMVRSSGDTFGAADAELDGRTLTITRGTHTFESTAGTLDELVAEINADGDLGVRASVLQVESGQYRLVLTSRETGTVNEFTATGDGWDDPFAVATTARDAVLDVGGITVTRSSNTITDLVDGATITLKAETTTPVTVNVTRDVDGISARVKLLVDAVNSALGEIKLRTAYDAENNRRSSLTGDATARTLAQELTAALTGVVGDNPLGSVGLAGVELARDGSLTFDAAAFKAAFESDPGSVERLFAASGEGTDGLSLISAGWRARTGSYEVELRNVDGAWTAWIGGEEATVAVQGDGSLRVAVQGTHPTLGGLTIRVRSDVADGVGAERVAVGEMDYTPGAAQRLRTATNRALDAVAGTLTTAEQTRSNRIKDINRQIEAFEIRLDKRELRLRQQYTALESLMGQLGNQATWLSGQIAGLTANMSANQR